jgi:hypothetical protein
VISKDIELRIGGKVSKWGVSVLMAFYVGYVNTKWESVNHFSNSLDNIKVGPLIGRRMSAMTNVLSTRMGREGSGPEDVLGKRRRRSEILVSPA